MEYNNNNDNNKLEVINEASPLKSSFLFTKNQNNKSKLIVFNSSSSNDIGKTRYLPPVSKEWKNSIYTYSNDIINFPVYDLNINSLIKGYFSLYFNRKFLKGGKYISPSLKIRSINKIFVSKAEIKHTNSKAIITLYVFNREKTILKERIQILKKFFFLTKFAKLKAKLSKFIFSLKSQILEGQDEVKQNSLRDIIQFIQHKIPKPSFFNKTNRVYYYKNTSFSKKVQALFLKVRRLRLKWTLNKYKFEEKFLSKLSKLIGKYYGKKVEFNIVNLNSIAYNIDILTEILTLNLRKEQSSPIYAMNKLLSKVKIDDLNRSLEKAKLGFEGNKKVFYKSKDLILTNLISEMPKNEVSLSSYKDNLNKILYNNYYKSLDNLNFKPKGLESGIIQDYFQKLRDIILENIKFKRLGGVRLVVKGRLTRRYRADRALYKMKWKGGLKNLESSYQGLPSVLFRGYLDPNVEMSKLASKRRIGSYAVKGWISGKN